MDSDSIGDRLKKIQISRCDNVILEEKVPKILSPEIHDVFHAFVNMLDVKSFMKLAMTSKEMYNRCMKGDKKIRIGVDVSELTPLSICGSLEFIFSFPDLSPRNHDGYLMALRKLPCKINLHKVEIHYLEQPAAVHGYMKEIGVKNIDELFFSEVTELELETLIAITKDFRIDSLHITEPIETDVLRSVLQLNLEKLYIHSKVPVEFLLELDSSIPEISFQFLRNISNEELMDILSKIQSGSLRRLNLNRTAVNWSNFDTIPFDYNGPLPYERPLILTRNAHIPFINTGEFWLLHWHGGVTKFVTLESNILLQFFKCEPWELPYILRKEEDVLKDLTEKRPSVSCSASQFAGFTTNFTMIDSSHEGPLPDARPLCFEVTENQVWMLDEKDNLTGCTWENGFATWKSYNPKSREKFEHPALAKHMFWKVIEQVCGSDSITLYCKGREEFNRWFEDFEDLYFGYSGALPDKRPLVFEKFSSIMEKEANPLRIVLLDHRLLQCEFDCDIVNIRICHCLNRPPVLYTAKNIMELLEDCYLEHVGFDINFEIIRDVLEQAKKHFWIMQNYDCEHGRTEFWYIVGGNLKQIVWQWGHFYILKISPPQNIMNEAFRHIAENLCYSTFTLGLGLYQFRCCLEQFKVVPFNYSGPLTNDSPLVFVKNVMRFSNFGCSAVAYILVWFLWNGRRLTKCSWGLDGFVEVYFGSNRAELTADIPPILKSKEYLKNLLEGSYNRWARYEWSGCFDDFYDYVKDFMKLPFDYDGRLPKERPLLFENRFKDGNTVHFVLRKDETIIKCSFGISSISLAFVSADYDADIPPALKNMS